MDDKLCLDCARRKLRGEELRACAKCAILNVDPLAQVRALAARPSPLANFSFVAAANGPFGAQVPAHSKRWRREP